MAKKIQPGDRVLLSNPTYPGIYHWGQFVSARNDKLEEGEFDTFTIQGDDGELHRSDGILTRPCNGEHDPSPYVSRGMAASAQAQWWGRAKFQPRPTYCKIEAHYVARYHHGPED